jgi:predicted metalloprotease with PDZ domain
MERLTFVVLAGLLLAGCAQHAILRDPQTGQTVNCTAMSAQEPYQAGRGLGGAIGAGAARGMAESLNERECVTSYQAAGFVRVDRQSAPAPVNTAILPVKIGMSLRGEGAGLRVLHVDYEGPAHKAGVKPGDLVLAINGQRVPTNAAAAALLRERAPGDMITLTLDRAGQLMTADAQLVAR